MQETAARALVQADGFRDEDHLARWASTVGVRVAIDDHRKQAAIAHVEVPDVAGAVDIEREVVARDELARAVDAIAKLTPQQRESLALSGAEPESRREAVKHNVRRHRVRLVLLAAMETIAALGAMARLVRRKSPAAAAGATAVVALTAMVTLQATRPVEAPAARPTVTFDRDRIASPASTVASGGRSNGTTLKTLPTPRAAVISPRAPTPNAPLPTFSVPIPGPAGDGAISGRPGQPGDPFVCFTTTINGRQCIERPPGYPL